MGSKRSKPKFYCDENFPVYAGEFLKSKGFSIEYAYLKNPGVNDILQIKYATKQKLILLTQDKDFKDRYFPKRRIVESNGIVIFRTDNPSKKNYFRMIIKLLKVLKHNKITGKLCEVSVDIVLIKEVIE